MSFAHLHTHSHYSLLDGLPKIGELVSAVKSRGMNAVALTDHGNMFGAIEFYQEAKRQGVKPIIGMEGYLAPNGIDDRTARERPFHVVLLAESTVGYQNLVQLATIAHLEGFYSKPRIDLEILAKHKEGIIVLSGCLSGEVARAVLDGGVEAARPVVLKYQELLGPDHFYLEVQHNPNTPEQLIVNKALLELHAETGVELVATNDSHYIDPEDAEAQDVLLCIQTKSLLADENRMSMRNEDYSLLTEARMEELFVDYPRAVENTGKIADRVHIEIELGTIQIPFYDLPEGVTPEQELRRMCQDGIGKRYSEVTAEIKDRVEYELDIISKTGFASYFLIVQDFINWAREQGVAVGPGRGSAAGSIVAYLTGITDIDPVHYELLFERFLNPERVSQPDIDTDFADIRRDDVLKYVEQRYGKDHVAQIITFGTMAARAAIRDVGRALGLSYGYCDRFAKLIPMFTTLTEALDTVPELRQMVEEDADAERLIRIAKKLEGVARHTSTHACAVVITKEPLQKQVPLLLDQDGATITQYSMNPVESLGLLKMDFLGLKNLTIIENTLNVVKATVGDDIDIENIPLDDKATFRVLKNADTVGVFQLESSGMRRYLKQLKPTEMEDIIAMVSLYRPGPMEFIPDYISGKHGKRVLTYIDEGLKPILEKTYGIAVYQEQIMEIARQLAGYSYGEADVLRKAVGKKNKAMLDEQEQKMVSGMVKNGIENSVAKQIWEFILPFARYGFNRSHAACYAMIAYRTAYLKANYPAQFMAALLTADYGNTDRVAYEVAQAEIMGLKVMAPDINESFGMFTVVTDTLDTDEPRIRFGLKAIKNVGGHIVEVIITERKEGGVFESLEDFLGRVRDRDLNKKSLESLIKVGALDRFGERSQLLHNIEFLLQYAKRVQEEEATGQTNLFGDSDEKPKLSLSPTPPVDSRVILQWERDLLGLYLSGHPLDRYARTLQQHSIPFAELKDYPKRKPITIIGMVTTAKKIITKKGEPMLFVGFADPTAEIEALVFPKTYKEFSTYWDEDSVLQITGKLDDKDGQIKILVEDVSRVNPDEMEQATREITVIVPAQMKRVEFEELKGILKKFPGDRRVILKIGEKRIDTRADVSLEAVTVISNLLGSDSVSVVE